MRRQLTRADYEAGKVVKGGYYVVKHFDSATGFRTIRIERVGDEKFGPEYSYSDEGDQYHYSDLYEVI